VSAVGAVELFIRITVYLFQIPATDSVNVNYSCYACAKRT